MSRSPASEHIRLMERRIREQAEKVETLQKSGADATQAQGRLKLLQHALEEMRAQLSSLSPTPMDGKRYGGSAKSSPGQGNPGGRNPGQKK
jgi:hypothetical protein